MGVAAGSLRLQPSEFIESRKDEEAMASVGGPETEGRRVGAAEDRTGRIKTDQDRPDRLRRSVS